MTFSRVTNGLFLATLFSVTFEKVHWSIAGQVALADLLTIGFLASFLLDTWHVRRWPRTVGVILLFLGGFLIVYFIGYFNIDSQDALNQFGKGLTKFVIHFLFLAAAVAYLAWGNRATYWRALGAFVLGMTANAAYGVIQLLVARAGGNLDSLVLGPITGGASSINIYGAVNGASVFRPNALTGDPNHLGIMLVVPLLVLTPVYLRLEKGHRLRWPLAGLLAFLALVEVATLSRSGLLGLIAGGLVLAIPYRRKLFSRALLAPVAVVVVILGAIVYSRLHYFEVVFRSRASASGSSTHFAVYGLVPDVLRLHPLFGLGLNDFSVYYQLVTGKTNWGPHSFYVALAVETGIVGTALFALFLYYVFRRLGAARRLGRAMTAANDPLAARVRPLAWGFTAALVGTMAANIFYLTMSFYYFYAFVALALAMPLVFRPRVYVASPAAHGGASSPT
ncbi:MAG: O-antigen ligase family protein [Gaiellaceae bacterium]